MTNDPFEQLRVADEPGRPRPPLRRPPARPPRRRPRRGGRPAHRPPAREDHHHDRHRHHHRHRTRPPRAPSPLTPYLCVARPPTPSTWYVDVLGAVETIRYTGDDGRIGHAELDIGGARFMLSDEYPELGVLSPTTLGGTAVALHLEVPDVDAAYERVVAGGGHGAGAAAGTRPTAPARSRWSTRSATAG